MSQTAPEPLVQALLKRDRWVVAGCLLLACLLAWAWLLQHSAPAPASGGMAMGGMDMPGMTMSPAPAFTPAAYGAAALMWALMMAAMMLPSAAPMILLYARFARTARAQGAVLAPTFVFAATYLTLWGVFSLAAAAIQLGLIASGVVSAANLAIGNGRLAGAVLLAAGLYQLTPLKRACLAQCRSPLSFVTRLWRPGPAGAIRLGLTHGLYCIGCCWLLMALLFVGGVMSLAWVAALALVVLLEKATPIGELGSKLLGALAATAGIALLLGARPPW